MSKDQTSSESNSAEQRRHPQGAALAAEVPSRLVIRDKRSTDNPPSNVLKASAFPEKETETTQFVTFGDGRGVVVTQPIPDLSANPEAAHIDWLGFSVVPPVGEGLEWLFGDLAALFNLPDVTPRGKGWMGYKQSAWLGDYGLVAWGGKHQRDTIHVEVNGAGCGHIKDWRGVAAWGNALEARITRIDLAHDDYEGRVCNLEQISDWHQAGGFKSGGRTPKLKHAGDFTEHTDGATLYVGSRGNKVLRCYEKGKQLGFPNSPWFRVELEVKNKNRIIPWECAEVPGQYLAGAYPCLSYLSGTQCKLKTNQKAAAMTLEVMEHNHARLSGRAINALMLENGERADVVVAKLRREGLPKRLVPYKQGLSSSDENS